MYPITPDGRYFVVKGQLWRCSNPKLPDEQRQRLVADLMAARRAVKCAKASDNAEQLQEARSQVDAAKVALGERGRFGGAMAVRTTTAITQPTLLMWYHSLIDAE
jgi:hypothetical protein